MRFKIEINLDNDAFYADQNAEIKRILEEIALNLEQNIYTVEIPCHERDLNGNRVASSVFTEKPEPAICTFCNSDYHMR